LERIDPKVRYPQHVTAQMRLPVLAAIPHVDWRHSSNGDHAAPVVEALRGLRLRLVHAAGPPAPLLLTVTSPGVGEGKSFLTCNLALAFADAGYRTLLIDGDTRRGVQHRMLGLEREPGLVDCLAGHLPMENVIQSTRYPGLSFMGFGSRLPRAPELLGSTPMSAMMARLRGEFAVVLVDSPPLAAGADPCVLATVTGNLMLVLRPGVSDLELAAAKLEVLDNLPVRIIGAVMNDVRPRGAYRYYTYDLQAYNKLRHDGDSSGSASPKKVLWGRV
jgi:tyrosine-protein kinase Etk/Wzc